MRRVVVGFIALGLLAVAGFFAWAFYATRGDWSGGSGAITIAMAIGVIGVGALTGALMWLAFYSARAGYDEAPRLKAREHADDEVELPGG